MGKAATKPGAKSNKPASPKKARHVPSMKEQLKKRKAKPVPTISVVSFVAELPVELYAYSITDTKDGFQHQFRLWTRGELEVASLMDANFVGLDLMGKYPLKFGMNLCLLFD